MKEIQMFMNSVASATSGRGHRVREFVCAYRPLRDTDGRVVGVPTLVLNDPRTAAAILAPLLADQTVEVFGVACLSTKNRLLAWHVLSRGTRSSTPVSMPDVFIPDRRSFSLLRYVDSPAAQDRLRDFLLEAYQAHEREVEQTATS